MTRLKSFSIAITSVALLCLISTYYTSRRHVVAAQASTTCTLTCPTVYLTSPSQAWPNNTGTGNFTILVNVLTPMSNSMGSVGSLSAAQESWIAFAVQQWTGTNNVSFKVQYGTSKISTPNSMNIIVGTPPAGTSVSGQFVPTSYNADGQSLSTADVYLTYNQAVMSNESAMISLTDHETGHSFGLGDNYDSCGSSTGTSAMFEDLGCRSSSPTCCDKINAAKGTTKYPTPPNQNANSGAGGTGGGSSGGGSGGGSGGTTGGGDDGGGGGCSFDPETNTETC